MINEDDFKFNKSNLSEERKIGVSGLMRVKNEAKFLELSIDSCIEALDELIIVYQKSNDNTAELIESISKQYPLKIKSFFYEPDIKSHKLTKQEFLELKNVPKDSINLLSNYYNYTLSKATYKYALKIDADQIYNSVKLKEVLDLYRKEDYVKISSIENIIGIFFNFLNILSYILNKFLNIKLFNILPSFCYQSYINYAYKKIQNDKITSSLSGLNIYIKDQIPYLMNGDYSKNSFPPFNGIYDHMIFKINENTFYEPSYIESNISKYGNCVIERFAWDKFVFNPYGLHHRIINLGFMWYHVAPLNFKDLNSRQIIPLLNNKNYTKIKKSCSIMLYNRSRIWFVFWLKNWNKQSSKYLNNWKYWLKRIEIINENCKNN